MEKLNIGRAINSKRNIFEVIKKNPVDPSQVAKKYDLSKSSSIMGILDNPIIPESTTDLIFPQGYVVDQPNKCLYVYFQRGNESLAEVIIALRNSQSYLPFEKIQKILHESVNSLSRLYQHSISHLHIKPSNIISMGQDKYCLCDYGEFSVNADDINYAAPEQTVVAQGNRFSKRKVEEIEVDIFRLGLSMMEIATLRGIDELKVFRNPKFMNSNLAINFKKEIGYRYGKKFEWLIGEMIQGEADKRVSLDELVTKHLREFMVVDKPHEVLVDANERAINVLLDDILRRIKERNYKPETFFSQYEMDNISYNINQAAFFDSLVDLGMRLSNQEKGLIIKTLSSGTDTLKLTQFVKQAGGAAVRMRELGLTQDKSLKELLKEVQTYSKEHNISLRQQFVRKDTKAQGYLDNVTFGDIMTLNKMELSSEDLKLVGDKYDPQDRGRIYYTYFCDDLENSSLASETELRALLLEIYQIIRNKFNTIDGFLHSLDPSKKGSIPIKDIGQFLGQFNIQPSQQVLTQLFNNIDPDNTQLAVYLRIRNILSPQVDQDLLKFLHSLTQCLINKSTTLASACMGAVDGLLNIEKLYDVLKGLGMTLKRPDLTFLLVTMRIERSKDNFIDINDMRLEFYKQAKRLGVNGLYVFKGVEDEEVVEKEKPQGGVYQRVIEKLKYKISFLNNQEILSLFDVTAQRDSFMSIDQFTQKIDEVDGTIEPLEKKNVYQRLDPNNEDKISSKLFLQLLGVECSELTSKVPLTQIEDQIQGFVPETFESMKDIIVAIIQGMNKLGRQPGQYFVPKKGKLDQTDYRYLLKQLEIYVADYKEMYENFARQISYPSDRNQIDVDKLLRVLEYYQSRQKSDQQVEKKEVISPQRTVFMWFERLVENMMKGKLDFYIFQDYDKMQYGFIRKHELESVLFDELGLEDDGTFSLLVNFIRDDRSGDISLRKLKEGIEKERDARFLHEDLIELVRENRMDIDRVFRNYDYNASQSMEIHEFERLVRTLQPDVSTSVVDVLFKKFDSNNEGSISLRKFRSRITGGSGGVTTQGDIKNLQIQHFIEDLDSLLQERKLKFDSVFGELTHQGTIKVDDFKDALKILGFPVDEDKTRMKLIIQSLILYNKQNRINVKLFKDYYNKSKKNNDDGEFVFSTEDMRRVENFSNLIERKLTRGQKTFEEIFVQKTKTFDGYFKFEDVKKIIQFNLQLDESMDSRIFFKYIQSGCPPDMVSIDQLKRLISKSGLSDKTYQEVLEFVSGNEMLANFRIEDQNECGFVTAVEFRRVFRAAKGPSLEPEEVRAICEKFVCIERGNINYKRFLEEVKKAHAASGGAGSELAKLCQKLKVDLGGQDLVELMQSYDRGDGRVRVTALLQELKFKNITITQKHQDLLFTVVEVDKNKSIDIHQLSNLIMGDGDVGDQKEKGYQSKKFTKFKEAELGGNVKISSTGVNVLVQKVRQAIMLYIEEHELNLKGLFKRLDRDNDEFISLKEFKLSLKELFRVTAKDEEVEAVFEKFDTARSFRLNQEEFELAIFGEAPTEQGIEKLLRNLKQALINTSQSNDITQQLIDAFNSIDVNGDGYVNLTEFSTMMRKQAPSIKLRDVEYLFKYFDKKDENRFSYEHFISVLRQDHLNLDKIKQNMDAYLKQNLLSLDAFYKKFSNESGVITLQNLKSMMLAINFRMDEEQCQDLFEFLDVDHDNRITRAEFTQIVVDKNMDLSKLFKKIRRLCLKHNFDLEMQLRQKDERQSGQISQYSFNKLLRLFTSHLHSYEMEQIFRHFDPKAIKIINYKDFLTKVQEISMDISPIVKHIQDAMKSYNITEQQIFKSFDPDHDDCITLEEFDSMLQSLGMGLPEEEIWECFQSFDLNSTGDISLLEFTQVLRGQKISREASIHLILQANQYNRRKVETHDLEGLYKPQQKKTVNFQQNLKSVDNGQILPPTESQQQIKHSSPVLTQLQVDQIVRQMNAFVLKRQRTMQQLVEYYFPQATDRLDEQTFLSITLGLESGIKEKEIRDLFYYLDTYVSGLVGIDQFKRVFMPLGEQVKKEVTPVVVTVKPKKRQLMSGQIQLEVLLTTVKAYVVKKKRTLQDLVQFFYPPGGVHELDEKSFIKTATRLGHMDLMPQQVVQLFHHLDSNGRGFINMNEFSLVFAPEKVVSAVSEKQVNCLDIEISLLFDSIDDNKNGFLDQGELHNALTSIGINAGPEELLYYFQMFDRDHDNTISKDEFMSIIKDFVRKEMGSVNDLLFDIRREFKNADTGKNRCLRPNQIKQVFGNLGINIPDEDIVILFKEIDTDRNGTLDIDELIYFIQKNREGMSARAAQVVMNIKGTQNISLKDIKAVFETMPSNFTHSFSRAQNKRSLNIPSSGFIHKLDDSGQFYSDIVYSQSILPDSMQSVLEKGITIPKIALQIQLLGAEGVPIPEEKLLPRDSILRRELAIMLYDRSKQLYLGNVVYIECQWQKDYEDRWTFNDQSIILKSRYFDERLDDSLDLVIEMIAYIKKLGKIVEATCCHAQIPLSNLIRTTGKMSSELRGGAPSKIIPIDQKDIRANRTGWRSMVAALGASITSNIRYEVKKINNNTTLSHLATLPPRVLLQYNALSYIHNYREYFAYCTVNSNSTQLHNNPSIKCLTSILDQHLVNDKLIEFWNSRISSRIQSFQLMYSMMQALGNGLFLLVNSQDFKFVRGDPTRRMFEANVIRQRQELLEHVFEDLLDGGRTKKKESYVMNYEPIKIYEMMEEDEDDMANFDRIMQKTKKHKIK